MITITDVDSGLSHARLLEMLSYDPLTGIWRWRIRRGGSAMRGQIAGYLRKDGYLQVIVNKRKYLGSRLAWFYMTGAWPKELIDHKDGDPSNNRFGNLREASVVQNRANSRSRKKSGLKGIHFSKSNKAWCAQNRTGDNWFCTFHKTPEEAYAAYASRALEMHGEFARVD